MSNAVQMFVYYPKTTVRICTEGMDYMIKLLFLFLFHIFLFQSMSGIEVDPRISRLFNDIKLKHTDKWATFKIENKKMIVLDKTDFPRGLNADEAQFTEMKDKLTLEPRYVLFDFHFKSTKDGRVIRKIAFIFWYVHLFGTLIKLWWDQYFILRSY